MHLGSLWPGSKKLPALEFLQVFMLGNDVFNFLNFLFMVCVCAHAHVCAVVCLWWSEDYRSLVSPSTTCVPGIKSGCQDWQQVTFPAEPSYQPPKISFMSLQYIHIFYEFCLTLWWPLAVAFWVLRSQVSVSFQVGVIVRCVCFLPFCL